LEGALAAERAGVDRVELCIGLDDGGTTPSAELISEVTHRLRIPVFVLVRPRTGAFVYTDDEIEVMIESIERGIQAGAAGIVIGVLTPDRRVDVARTKVLLEAAGNVPVTFHRAFDVIAEQVEALELLVDLGVKRVLTSGGAATALEGAGAIATLRKTARGRIVIVAAGGIREHNVREVVARTGVSEVHGRFVGESGMRHLVEIAHQSGLHSK
jgi:copper homeostasis protein